MNTIEDEQPVSATVNVDGQSRVVLPRAIRDAAQVNPGDELTMFADRQGRIVLATREAVAAELRAMFAAGKTAQPWGAGDSTARLRQARDEDARAEEEKRDRLSADRRARG